MPGPSIAFRKRGPARRVALPSCGNGCFIRIASGKLRAEQARRSSAFVVGEHLGADVLVGEEDPSLRAHCELTLLRRAFVRLNQLEAWAGMLRTLGIQDCHRKSELK